MQMKLSSSSHYYFHNQTLNNVFRNILINLARIAILAGRDQVVVDKLLSLSFLLVDAFPFLSPLDSNLVHPIIKKHSATLSHGMSE